MRAKTTLWAIVLLLLVSVTALGARAQTSDVDVALTFSNLAPLADDHYEGWLIVGGSPVSTGKFLVTTGGEVEDLQGNAVSAFRVPNVDLDRTTRFVLTIEPAGDTDAVPGAVKPLAGDLNAAKTSAALAPNLGVSLAGIAGTYILATPSDGMDTSEKSGVWFLDRSGGAPVAGLTLPDLTGTDWVYEGWAVIQGTPVTTGKFDMPEGADMSAPYSGTQGTPPFPGEDFLLNAPSGLVFPTDLSGQTIVISVEPRVDDDPGPFQFKPLLGTVPAGATDHLEYDLTDQSASLATGTATIAQVAAGVSFDIVVIGVAIAAVVAAAVIVVVALLRRRKE